MMAWLHEALPHQEEIADRTAIADHTKSLDSLASYQGNCIVCLCSKTSTAERRKTSFSVKDNFVEPGNILPRRMALDPAFEVLYGRAPKSGVERQISAKLDNYQRRQK